MGRTASVPDRTILEARERLPGASLRDLGEEVGLSPSALSYRLRRLGHRQADPTQPIGDERMVRLSMRVPTDVRAWASRVGPERVREVLTVGMEADAGAGPCVGDTP